MKPFGNWSNPWNTQSLAGWLDMACKCDRSTSVPIPTPKILTAAFRKRRNGVMMFLLDGDRSCNEYKGPLDIRPASAEHN